MRKDHYRPTNVKATLALGFFLLLGAPLAAQAGDVPKVIREAIHQEFPGATIKEIEQEVWKGQPVTEVELTSRDGVDYEVVLSDSGEILNVEEEEGLPWIGGELSLGVALFVERDIYMGVDTEFQPVPFFEYENGPLEIQATDSIDATYAFYRSDRFSVALIESIELEEGYDTDDSDFLKGMDELETLYGAGLELEGMVAGWEAGLEVLQDVSGEHDGQQVELSLTYPWTAAGFEWHPEFSLTWMSEKTVDYLYGVSAKEARAGRPAYAPGSSFEIGAELMVQRPLFGDFTAVGIFEISTFGSDVTDSPLVDEDYAIEGVLGVMYTF
ncbi:MAG: MipA/OmpV family protein [Thermodesulfobacteriota bacterium]|nr:MipA/OmpV family protein [Thermodesulfobacteriota bacterium]